MAADMLLIMGCTASGKSSLAFSLAQRLGGEIISIDSMKVYRRMDIGTAKPSADRLAAVKHHLIDVVEPSESFSMGKFIELADKAIAELQQAQRPIIAAGGTPMYIRGLLEGIFDGPGADAEIRERIKMELDERGPEAMYQRLAEIDPEAVRKIHLNDSRRIIRALEVYELTGKPISSFHTHFRSGNYRYPWQLIGLRWEKEIGNRRINARVKKMVQDGLVGEVESLLAEPEPLSEQAAVALGYAEIIEHLQGKISLEDAVEKIKINSRRFAKGQRTWYRSFVGVNWIDLQESDTAESIADRLIAEYDLK